MVWIERVLVVDEAAPYLADDGAEQPGLAAESQVDGAYRDARLAGDRRQADALITALQK